MPSQGPTIVSTGVDGNENASGAWTNPQNASSASSSSVALATAGTSPTLNTNTLKCQFNAASFSIPASTITDITLAFRAWSSGGMGSPIVNVASVKTSLTTSNFTDNATLSSSDSAFSYIVTDPMPTATQVNGAWEIDLVFSSPNSTDFGDVNLYDVKATVSYTGDDTDAAQINGRVMISEP